MVDGTGLENQQINVSQVRILSLPPCLLQGIFKKQDSDLALRARCESCPFRHVLSELFFYCIIYYILGASRCDNLRLYHIAPPLRGKIRDFALMSLNVVNNATTTFIEIMVYWRYGNIQI